MKTFNTILIATLVALTLACGYSRKSGTPGSGMPAISNLSPGSTTAGSADFTLTVNGSNFASNASVNWNGTAQTTTRVTGAQLSIVVPAAAVANAGTVQVTVTNPAVSGGIYGGTPAQTSTPMTFTIN